MYNKYLICSSSDTQTTLCSYATSKAGLRMMTKKMALELATDNIRANIVALGAVKTDMNGELGENKV